MTVQAMELSSTMVVSLFDADVFHSRQMIFYTVGVVKLCSNRVWRLLGKRKQNEEHDDFNSTHCTNQKLRLRRVVSSGSQHNQNNIFVKTAIRMEPIIHAHHL